MPTQFFGEMRIFNGSGVEIQDSQAGNIYGFTGREFDSESHLYYYRARYYDPSLGRFLTADPIGFASGDTNFYRYVLNNPNIYKDPSGKIITIGAIILVGIAIEIISDGIKPEPTVNQPTPNLFDEIKEDTSILNDIKDIINDIDDIINPPVEVDNIRKCG
jgi:RHS repeat-associated protein